MTGLGLCRRREGLQNQVAFGGCFDVRLLNEFQAELRQWELGL